MWSWILKDVSASLELQVSQNGPTYVRYFLRTCLLMYSVVYIPGALFVTYLEPDASQDPTKLGIPWSQNSQLPRPSNYLLLDSKYHQTRTIRFQLRVVERSRSAATSTVPIASEQSVDGLYT